MNIDENKSFKYEDTSNKIFTKINLVNNLTLDEIGLLNEKYRELGLFIKQVRVDNYGKEKSPNDLIKQNFLSKKRLLKRHSKMTLEQLYYKYFCLDPFSSKLRCLRSFHKEIEDELLDIEDLKELKQNLLEVHQDYQKLESKRCSIKKLEFKKEIIKYIQKFNAYLTTKQYEELYKKMKEKSMLVLEISKIDDLEEWTVPLLKEFKAEVEFLAISNILKKHIGEEDEKEEEKLSNEEENQKIEDEEKNDNSSYSSEP